MPLRCPLGPSTPGGPIQIFLTDSIKEAFAFSLFLFPDELPATPVGPIGPTSPLIPAEPMKKTNYR